MAANRLWAWPLALAMVVLVGCGGPTIRRDYQPNPAEPLVDFELVLLDPMTANETFDFHNYIWTDCKEKPIMEAIAELDGSDFTRKKAPAPIKTRLPAGRQLKLSMWHELKYGSEAIYCMGTVAYTFKAGKKYRYQMHNWSTPGSKHDGFGCFHEMLEMDASGGNARQIYGTIPPTVNCK